MKHFIYHMSMLRGRKPLTRQYGKAFWKKFQKGSRAAFRQFAKRLPDIGESVFRFNFQFLPAYAAWFQTLTALGLSREEIDRVIWLLNERFVTIVPRKLLHATGVSYFSNFRKKTAKHIARQKRGELHPWDWTIIYRDVDSNTFEIDITRCAMQLCAREFGVEGLLPGICRMDFLFSSLMGNGFRRTKTLGDGDDCCNCHYQLKGRCEWNPEKGFLNRK